MPQTSRQSPQPDPTYTTAERPLAGGAALLANWNGSLADFYFRRVQKYWHYPAELAELRSLEEVAGSLLEFEAELLADYADQADELLRIVSGERRQAHGVPGQHYEARILKAQKDAAAIIDQAKAQAERIVDSARSQADEMIANGAKHASGEVRR